MKQKRIRTVLGLSCGVGVSLFPFKKTCHIMGNIESRTDFYIGGKPMQYALNLPGVMWPDPKGWTSFIDRVIDIVIAQPKCGNSSVLAYSRGKKMTSHEGEPSLEIVMEGIKKLQPKVWLLENLPALLNTFSRGELMQFFNGYRLHFHHVPVSAFGNGQKTRKRLIIVGVREHIKYSRKIWAALGEIHPIHKPMTVGECLKHTASNGHFRPPLNEPIAIYGGKQLTYEQIQEYWQGPLAGLKRWATPDENFSTAPGVYRDLWDEYPATIRKSNRCFGPSGLSYTPRERARIQGIPDEFRLLDPADTPEIAEKTLFNKGCAACANTPPMEVGYWFKQVLQKVNFI